MRTLLILALLSAPAHAGRRYCYPTTQRVQKVYVQQSSGYAASGDVLDKLSNRLASDAVWYQRFDNLLAQYQPQQGGGSYAQAQSTYVPPQGNTFYGYETKIELRKPFDRDAAVARADRLTERAMELAATSMSGRNDQVDAYTADDGAVARIQAAESLVTSMLRETQPRDVTITTSNSSNYSNSNESYSNVGKITPPAITSLGSRLDGDASLVQALFSQTCLSCHSGETTKGGVDLGGELTEELRMKAVFEVMGGTMPKGPDDEANPLPGPQRDALGAWLAGEK